MHTVAASRSFIRASIIIIALVLIVFGYVVYAMA
jgi:hypothetical protein